MRHQVVITPPGFARCSPSPPSPRPLPLPPAQTNRPAEARHMGGRKQHKPYLCRANFSPSGRGHYSVHVWHAREPWPQCLHHGLASRVPAGTGPAGRSHRATLTSPSLHNVDPTPSASSCFTHGAARRHCQARICVPHSTGLFCYVISSRCHIATLALPRPCTEPTLRHWHPWSPHRATLNHWWHEAAAVPHCLGAAPERRLIRIPSPAASPHRASPDGGSTECHTASFAAKSRSGSGDTLASRELAPAACAEALARRGGGAAPCVTRSTLHTPHSGRRRLSRTHAAEPLRRLARPQLRISWVAWQ